jgi:hypothetical protein
MEFGIRIARWRIDVPPGITRGSSVVYPGAVLTFDSTSWLNNKSTMAGLPEAIA